MSLTQSLICLVIYLASGTMCAGDQPQWSVERLDDQLKLTYAGRPVATYVYRDPAIARPYFAHVYSPSGRQLTRNHPPQGHDPSDHALMHPGIWLAFGDLSGGDFWRNKDRVVHVQFVQAPQVDGQRIRFAVLNRYERADGTSVCRERCELQLSQTQWGWMLAWDSQFSSDHEFYFGDQEEMGLGVRVATPLSVKLGGHMLDSEGRRNERQIWGQSSRWCDYQGVVSGQPAGVAIMSQTQNFRTSWIHARDYGLVVSNPFGRQAFGQGAVSKVVVQPGDVLRLRYGVLLHDGVTPAQLDAAWMEYEDSAEAR